jgi:oligopeptidase B
MPIPRQSPPSPHPLLPSPRKIPDPYGWMRDDSRTDATVLDHLRAENEYAERTTSHLADLRGELYREVSARAFFRSGPSSPRRSFAEDANRDVARRDRVRWCQFLSGIRETDYSTPALGTAPAGRKGYWYYTRFEAGQGYPRYCRAPRSSPDELYPPPANGGWDERLEEGSDAEISPLGPLLPGEEVYLDVPALARGGTYLATGAIAVSPDQKHVAYTLDEKGGERCQLHVKRIESGEVWTLRERNVHRNATDGGTAPLECDGSVVWNDSGDALFYVTMDDAHRPHRLHRRRVLDSDGHWIDAEDPDDELLMAEDDESFNLRIAKSFDGRYLLVRSSSKESSEVHYLDLRPETGSRGTSPANDLVCIAKRKHKVLYRVAHCRGYWLVQTNIGGLPNLSLKACRVGEEGTETWVVGSDADTPVPVFDGGHARSLDVSDRIVPRTSIRIVTPSQFFRAQGVTVFNPPGEDASPSPPLAYAVVTGREDGMPRVWILELSGGGTPRSKDVSQLTVSRMTRLEFDESAYDVGIGGNRDPSLPYVVICYDSLVTPPSHIAVPLHRPSDMSARKVLKAKDVPGYSKDSYAYERTTVRSRDGKTDIPVSLVYHRDVLRERNNGPVPTHLYGYGSYGASIEASFRSTRLPLLNRKVVYALAHVRGGGEMGRPWYDEAKYLTKMNTFNDFVDVARWLAGDATDAGSDANSAEEASIGRGITIPGKLSCEGRSAGGLLVGASLNQHPELFRAAILGVPFVDVACKKYARTRASFSTN